MEFYFISFITIKTRTVLNVCRKNKNCFMSKASYTTPEFLAEEHVHLEEKIPQNLKVPLA